MIRRYAVMHDVVSVDWVYVTADPSRVSVGGSRPLGLRLSLSLLLLHLHLQDLHDALHVILFPFYCLL